MPIYEYVCHKCRYKFTELVRESTGGTRLEEASDPDKLGPDYYKDPRNIGCWAEKRFKEMGVEMPRELQEKIGATRDGILSDPLKDL